MGDVLRHDKCLTLAEDEHLTADGETACAVEHRDHRVAACCVGGYFLAFVEREESHADGVVLHKRLADDLPVLIIHKILKQKLFLLGNVFVRLSDLRNL